jgi:hypothetical protein
MIATVDIRGQQSYGWIPPDVRTSDEKAAHVANVAEMPVWSLTGDDWGVEKAFLWEISKKANGGNHLPTLYQQTGSCVGNGGWCAYMHLAAFEIIRLGDAESLKILFMPYTYDRGQLAAGIHGRGDGSTGSGQAKAARTDGVISNDLTGLPQPKDDGGLTWGKSVELDWSAGERITDRWLLEGRQHLVKATSQVKNAADVRAAICNGYPVTIASNWGGQMSPPVKDGVLLNRRVTQWGHQMAIIGWWKHPSHGEIFYVQNSWGRDVHGTCPSGAPPGGFWVHAGDVDYITDQDDSFAHSQFDGFPAQQIDWSLV